MVSDVKTPRHYFQLFIALELECTRQAEGSSFSAQVLTIAFISLRANVNK